MPRLDLPHSLAGLRRKFKRLASAAREVDRPPREVLRPEFLAGLKRLDLQAKVILQGFLQGLHRMPRRGFSSEFSEHRNFSSGDDSRWIDWRLYARTDRLFLKCFESESAMRATLVLDGSASMGYCSRQALAQGEGPFFTKLGYAVALTAALACLLQHQRDRSGLFLIGGSQGGNRLLPPRSSRHQSRRILQELTAFRAGGAADLAAALRGLADQERRRGLVAICSDGLTGRAALFEALQRLRHRGHAVLFFQVWDPAELDPPFEPGGGSALRDPETGATFAPLPRALYQQRAREHLAEVRQGCLALGCEHQFLLTTTAFDRALLRFLRLRRG